MHYPKVVLVTGACRFLGGYLTARLAQNPLINGVIAVDAIAPSKDMLRRMGRAEFVRADIRNPFIAKVIRNGDVDTVVHAAAASYAPRSGGSAALKEINVMGAMQLFAACQKAPSVRRVVLKSTSEVYGSSAHDPVMFTEDSSSRRPFRDGFAKDSLDIEGYARGLGRRRPDIAVTILRLANMIGPAMDTTLSRYLAGPLVPTMFGRDARLQLLHEQDALGALERAAMAGKAGTFNIGADGIIMLSQAIRRAGRIPLPVPGFGVWALDSLQTGESLQRDHSRSIQLFELWPRHGHHADALRTWLPAQMDDGRGVRRLRSRPRPDSHNRPASGTLPGGSRHSD